MAHIWTRRQNGRRMLAWPVGLAVAFALGTLLSTLAGGGVLGALAGAGGAGAPTAYGATLGSGSGTARPITQQVPVVHATIPWSKTLPARSAAERQAEARAQQLHEQLKPVPHGPLADVPPLDPRTISPPLPAPRYALQHPPAAASTSSTTTQPVTAPGGTHADADFAVELGSSPGSIGICKDCGLSDYMSTSVANRGKSLFETGNWFTTQSNTGGAGWFAVDPFTYFAGLGHGSFCCDQQVLYEPSRDTFIWEALTFGGFGSAANGLWLAVVPADNLLVNCAVWVSGPTFGLPAGTLLDLPQIEYSANFLYLTWTSYDGTGAWLNTGLARFDLTPLATCTALSGSSCTRTDNFAFALGQGATDTMYWASNWYTSGSGNGTAARFFFWGEHSGSYTYLDKSIPAYNFLTGWGSVKCASQDGLITDFCKRLDSRRGTLFRSRAGFKGFGAPMLGYFIQAGPTSGFGSCDPFPFVEAVYFLLSNMTLKQYEYHYSCGFAVAYPSAAAPTQRGYIGAQFTYGSGIGTGSSAVDYYPSNFYLILDADAPNAPGALAYTTGNGNSVDGGWGDYNIARPYNPDQLHWIAGGWYMNGSTPVPLVVIWGRARDHRSYLHWSTT